MSALYERMIRDVGCLPVDQCPSRVPPHIKRWDGRHPVVAQGSRPGCVVAGIDPASGGFKLCTGDIAPQPNSVGECRIYQSSKT